MRGQNHLPSAFEDLDFLPQGPRLPIGVRRGSDGEDSLAGCGNFEVNGAKGPRPAADAQVEGEPASDHADVRAGGRCAGESTAGGNKQPVHAPGFSATMSTPMSTPSSPAAQYPGRAGQVRSNGDGRGFVSRPACGRRSCELDGRLCQPHRRWMNELLVGYARVSIERQDLTSPAQRAARARRGDDRICVDHGLTGTNRTSKQSPASAPSASQRLETSSGAHRTRECARFRVSADRSSSKEVRQPPVSGRMETSLSIRWAMRSCLSG